MENTILCELPDPQIHGLESLSPFCLKVHRGLKLQKHTYERRFGRSPGSFSALNPRAKVPVLLIGDEVICDSTTILQRLEVPGNGEAMLWEELADTSLAGFLVAARWACESNWPLVKQAYFGAMPAPVHALIPGLLRRKVIKGLELREIWGAGPDECWNRFGQLLDQLNERAPDEGYWMGEEITVADLGLFAQLHSMRTELTAFQSSEIAKRTALSAWLDRVDEGTQ